MLAFSVRLFPWLILFVSFVSSSKPTTNGLLKLGAYAISENAERVGSFVDSQLLETNCETRYKNITLKNLVDVIQISVVCDIETLEKLLAPLAENFNIETKLVSVATEAQPTGNLVKSEKTLNPKQSEISVISAVPAGFEYLAEESLLTPIDLKVNDLLISEGFLSSHSVEKELVINAQYLPLNTLLLCGNYKILIEILNCNEKENYQVEFIEVQNRDEYYVSLVPDAEGEKLLAKHLGFELSQHGAEGEVYTHIGPSSVDGISGALKYSANISATDEEIKAGSVTLNGKVSYDEFNIVSAPIYRYSKYQSTVDVDYLLVQKIKDGRDLNFGVKSGFESLPNNTQQGSNISSVAGVWMGSTGLTAKGNSNIKAEPIVVYMPASGMIEIYRGQRLLYVSVHDAGSISISTDDFPRGVYDVVIIRKPTGTKELEPYVSRVYKSEANINDWSFGIGMAALDNKPGEDSFYDRNYEKLYFSGDYKFPVARGISGQLGAYYLNEDVYAEVNANVFRYSPFNFDLGTIQSESGDAYYRASFRDDIVLPSGRLSYSFSWNKDSTKFRTSEYHSISLNYIPEHTQYVDSVMLSYSSNDNTSYFYNDEFQDYVYENAFGHHVDGQVREFNGSPDNQHRNKFRESLLSVSKTINSLGAGSRLTTDFRYNDDDKFSFNIGLTVDFGSAGSWRGKGSYIYNEGNQVEANLNYNNRSALVNNVNMTANYSELNYSLAGSANATSDIANLSFGGVLNKSLEGDKSTHQNYYGVASGGLYFSGDDSVIALSNKITDSGLIVNVIENDNSSTESNFRVSIKNQGEHRVSQGVQVIPVPAFEESKLYFSSEDAVIDASKTHVTLYPGNFQYVEVMARPIVNVAGYIKMSDYKPRGEVGLKNHESEVLLKNHESEVLLKNHESEVLLKNHESELAKNLNKEVDEDLFFEMQVSRNYPTIDIYNDGKFKCTKNIEPYLNAIANDVNFVYIDYVSCGSPNDKR